MNYQLKTYLSVFVRNIYIQFIICYIMGFSVFLIVTLVIILLIWLLIEIKRAKHKIFAIAIILLILFFYFSIAHVFKGTNVDYKTVNGITDASKLYLSWLGGFYGNLKTITTNVIKMKWDNKNSNITINTQQSGINNLPKTSGTKSSTNK